MSDEATDKPVRGKRKPWIERHRALILLRLTDAERDAVNEAAAREGLTQRDFIRTRIGLPKYNGG